MNEQQQTQLENSTPEQKVFEILRCARDKFGRDLKPFYQQILALQPKPQKDDYSAIRALAKHRREKT